MWALPLRPEIANRRAALPQRDAAPHAAGSAVGETDTGRFGLCEWPAIAAGGGGTAPARGFSFPQLHRRRPVAMDGRRGATPRGCLGHRGVPVRGGAVDEVCSPGAREGDL